MEACHLVSSQASLRLPQLVPVPFQWAPSDRSRDHVPGTISSFHGTWIYSCISCRHGSLLWRHALLIELQVDAVSRECEGFIIVAFRLDTTWFLLLPWSQSWNNGNATLNKRFIRVRHEHNILIKIDITDQGNLMHESAKADVIFVAF